MDVLHHAWMKRTSHIAAETAFSLVAATGIGTAHTRANDASAVTALL